MTHKAKTQEGDAVNGPAMRVIKLNQEDLKESLHRYLINGISVKTYFEDKKEVQAFELVDVPLRYELKKEFIQMTMMDFIQED